MHGGRPGTGDQRMPGVVIGCGGGDLHPAGDRAGGADERGRFLDVPPLLDERGAEAPLFARACLVHQRGGSLTAGAGQQVVAQFLEDRIGHAQTPCLYPQFQTSVILLSITRKISLLLIVDWVPSFNVSGDSYTIATCSPSSPATRGSGRTTACRTSPSCPQCAG